MISKELLEILICPACRAKVLSDVAGTSLRCVGCRRVYPVEDGIPIMLVDRARLEE